MSAPEVLAAGGLIVRGAGDEVELLVIHRPKYDDWSFPKGKLDPGESFEDGALREVLEETGLSCRLDAPLSTVRYIDTRGRTKEVRYWLMAVARGDIGSRAADLEVDAARWLTPASADELLTYQRDRELLTEALGILGARDS